MRQDQKRNAHCAHMDTPRTGTRVFTVEITAAWLDAFANRTPFRIAAVQSALPIGQGRAGVVSRIRS